MRRVAFVALVIAIGGLMGCGNSASSDDLSRFQGTWAVVKVEYPAEFPEAARQETEDGIKDTEVVISGEQITGIMPKKVGSTEKETVKGSFKLDPSKSPHSIDITGTAEGKAEPTTIGGIYKFEGNTLVVAVAMGKDGFAGRPTEFKSITEKKDTPEARLVIVIHLKKK